MDAAPTDRDREDARCLRRADVEGRVADVDRLARRAPKLLEREENRIGLRLVALRVLVRDDDVEHLLEGGETVECEPDGPMPLRGDKAELAALRLEPRKQLEQLVERLERLV